MYFTTNFPNQIIIGKILCEELENKNIGEPITNKDIGKILLRIKKATEKRMISASEIEPGLKKYRVAFIDGKSTLAIDDIVSMIKIDITIPDYNMYTTGVSNREVTRYKFLRMSDFTTHDTRTSNGYILVEGID